MPNSTVGVRLSDDTQQRLERLGQARDRSPHYLMEVAIEQFLDREEALEAERFFVRERWARYERSGETVAHADVRAWAESLGQPGDHQAD
ncbi:MAG: ribbon-helix-helix protein, CopG family [Pseudomonadota bacterium]